MKFCKLFIFLLLPTYTIFSQPEVHSIKSIKKTDIKWKKIHKSNNILIEFSFQEDNPKRGYKGEYLILRIINSSNSDKTVSWDFYAKYDAEKCLNCNSDNQELHFEQTIPAKSFLSNNINNHYKGPLIIFHRFTDNRYIGNNKKEWLSFDLKNLSIK